DPLTGAEAQGAAGPAELGIYLSSFETDPSGFDPFTFDQDEAAREAGLNQCPNTNGTGQNGLGVQECEYTDGPRVPHVPGQYNPNFEQNAGQILNLRVRLRKLILYRADDPTQPVEVDFDGTQTPIVDVVQAMHQPQFVATTQLEPGEYVRMSAELEVVDFEATQLSRQIFRCDKSCNFQCPRTQRVVRNVCYRARCRPIPGTERITLPILSDDFTRLIVDGSHGFNRVIEIEANATCSQDYPGDPTTYGDGVVFLKKSQIIPLGPFG
ncbi:MAG: hypothetical protein D6718_04290, partial [Acidobacteria bacterium]